MGDDLATQALHRYLEPGETVRAAFPTYTPWGLGRRILGITDRRLLLLRSRYWSVTATGLMWADPLPEVAVGRVQHSRFDEIDNGNSYLEFHRAYGAVVRLNMRSAFVTDLSSARRNIASVLDLVPRQ